MTTNAEYGSPVIYTVAWTPDGERIVCGTRRGPILCFDAESGDETLQLEGHEAYVKALAFRPGCTVLASASGDCSARLWDDRPLTVRLEEDRRVLEAEASVASRVEALFKRLETKEAVVDAIDADEELSALEKHAAGNLVLRR